MGKKVPPTTLRLMNQIYTHWEFVPMALSVSYIYRHFAASSSTVHSLFSLISLNISLLWLSKLSIRWIANLLILSNSLFEFVDLLKNYLKDYCIIREGHHFNQCNMGMLFSINNDDDGPQSKTLLIIIISPCVYYNWTISFIDSLVWSMLRWFSDL